MREASVLSVRDLSKSFGGLTAVNAVSFDYEGGRPLGIIGPNGSGKTTLFNLITGQHRRDSGRVLFQGRELTGRSPEDIARAGVRRTFQQAMTFADLTVEENLGVALGDILKNSRPGSIWEDQPGPADFLLEFCSIAEFRRHQVQDVPFGISRLLGVAMALAAPVGLLLLDEPAAGLTEGEARRLSAVIGAVSSRGVPIIVVDHNTTFVFDLCSEILVLESGSLLLRGRPEEVSRNPDVIAVYLGARFARGE